MRFLTVFLGEGFCFLLPLPFIGGIGPRTALVTLIIYAFLPIVRTTVSGLQGLDHSVKLGANFGQLRQTVSGGK